MIKIKTPIWKTRSVGIAEHKAGESVQILYKDRFGDRLYPKTYKMSREQVLTYPLQIRRRVRLRIVPIKDFT